MASRLGAMLSNKGLVPMVLPGGVYIVQHMERNEKASFLCPSPNAHTTQNWGSAWCAECTRWDKLSPQGAQEVGTGPTGSM